VTLLTGILPLSNFVGQAQWGSISWFITTDDVRSRRFFLDIVLNIVVYVTFGFFYARQALTKGHINPTRGVLFAFLLSGSIEFYQVFCEHRFPLMLDLLNNTAGAIIGVVVTKSMFDRLPPHSQPTGS
jgi:glycopeptide antibiotics resistance protein